MEKSPARQPIAVTLHATQYDLLSRLPPNERAKPGQRAVYAALPQVKLKTTHIYSADNAVIEDVIMENWRMSRDGGGYPIIKLTSPLYVIIKHGGVVEAPTIYGHSVENPSNTMLLPTFEVRTISEDSAVLAPNAATEFGRRIDFDFVPDKIVVEVENDLPGVLVSEIKYGMRSLMASSGEVPASVFKPTVAPQISFSKHNEPVAIGMRISALLVSPRACKVSVKAIGRGVIPDYDVGVLPL